MNDVLLNIVAQIDPQIAVNNIANENIIGSFFIISLFVAITVAIVMKKIIMKLFEKMNEERLEKDKEADKQRQIFIDYLIQKNDVFVEVIKNYSDSNDALKMVLEKILMK